MKESVESVSKSVQKSVKVYELSNMQISPDLILTRKNRNSKEIIINIIIMSSKKADKYKPKPARANATVRAARARAEQRRLEEVEQLAAAQRAEQRGT